MSSYDGDEGDDWDLPAREREVCGPPLIPYNVLRLNYVFVLIIVSDLKLVLARLHLSYCVHTSSLRINCVRVCVCPCVRACVYVWCGYHCFRTRSPRFL